MTALLQQLTDYLLANAPQGVGGVGQIIAGFFLAFEVAQDRLKGSTWLLRFPRMVIQRAWSELRYLRSLQETKRLNRWKRRYVSLQSLEVREEARGREPEPILRNLRESVGRREQLIILGDPGSGKSTVVEALAYRLAVSTYQKTLLTWFLYTLFLLVLGYLYWPAAVLSLFGVIPVERNVLGSPIPVFIGLRSFVGGNVEELIGRSLSGVVGGETISENRRFYAESGRLVLIVDGLNEMSAKDYDFVLYAWRELFVPGHYITLTPVIFTSRRRKDPSEVLGIDRVLMIQELSDSAVKSFLKSYGVSNTRVLVSKLREHGLLEEGGLGRNPYWLRMITASGVHSPNQARVLEAFCRNTIKRELNKGSSDWPWESVDDVLEVLAYVGRRMTELSWVGAGFDSLEPWLEEYEAERNQECSAAELLEFAQAATLMRFSRREKRLEFSHHLVQEFFSAYDLRQAPDRALEHLDEVHWWQPLLLLGAMVQDRHSFLQKVLGDRTEASRVLLTFILRDMQEKSEEKAQDSLADDLTACLGRGITTEERSKLAELARIMPATTARALLALSSRGESGNVRREIFALARHIGGEFGASLVCEPDILRHSESVDEACQTLVEIGAACGLPLVRLLEQDIDPVPVAHVLEAVGDERVTKPLLNMLTTDVRPEVRETILGILGSIRDPRAVTPLLNMLGNSRQAIAKTSLIRTLGKIGDPRALELLRKIQEETDAADELARQAAVALRNIGEVQSIAPLVEGLRASEWLERDAARDALKATAQRSEVPALVTALKDPNWSVRAEVVSILGDLGDRRAIAPLTISLWDRDPRVRWRAAESLGKLGDFDSVEELKRVSHEKEHPVVARAACRAIEQITAKTPLQIQ